MVDNFQYKRINDHPLLFFAQPNMGQYGPATLSTGSLYEGPHRVQEGVLRLHNLSGGRARARLDDIIRRLDPFVSIENNKIEPNKKYDSYYKKNNENKVTPYDFRCIKEIAEKSGVASLSSNEITFENFSDQISDRKGGKF